MSIPTQSSFQMSPEELARYNAACPPTGVYFGRIFKFVHYGTVETEWQGQKKETNQYEMHMEIMSHEPFVFRAEKGPQPWSCRISGAYLFTDKSKLKIFAKQLFSSDPKVGPELARDHFEAVWFLHAPLVMITTEKIVGKNSGKAGIKVTNLSLPPAGLNLGDLPTRRPQNEYVYFDVEEFLKRNPKQLEMFKKLSHYEQERVFSAKEVRTLGLRMDDFKAAGTQQPYTAQNTVQQQQPVYQQPVQQQPVYQQPVQQPMQPPMQPQQPSYGVPTPPTPPPATQGSGFGFGDDDLPF